MVFNPLNANFKNRSLTVEFFKPFFPGVQSLEILVDADAIICIEFFLKSEICISAGTGIGTGTGTGIVIKKSRFKWFYKKQGC